MFAFCPYTQVSDSGPHGPLVSYCFLFLLLSGNLQKDLMHLPLGNTTVLSLYGEKLSKGEAGPRSAIGRAPVS